MRMDGIRSRGGRILGLSVLAGVVAIGTMAVTPTTAAPSAADEQRTARAIEMADDLSAAFEHASEVIGPSLVTVISQQTIEIRGRRAPQVPAPFRQFFDDRFFEEFFATPERRRRVRRGQGSGVVVSDDGIILTNAHVVEDATEVTVRLADDRELSAEVVGTDPRTDVAVLKIDATGLTPARLSDSDDLHVGQWVVAAGAPLGLSSTFTAGIVSATGRSQMGITDYEDFIQTDAAINPGNSGGPLVNLRGEVVGINTAIATRTGGFMGIGFAIPIDMARSIMENLIDDGEVQRGWLGVVIQELSDELAASFGVEGEAGVLVSDVTEGGPAERAGLEAGDIIARFNGRKLGSVNDLRLAVAASGPGERVEVEVFRNGKRRTFEVELGDLESGLARVGPGSEMRLDERLGLELEDLTPELAERLGLRATTSGVIVTDVEPMGPAARAGLGRGDVILSAAGQRVSSVGEFAQVTASHRGQIIRLIVLSQGVKRFAALRIPG